MRANRSLSEHDQVARQNVRAFHRDGHRHRALKIAHCSSAGRRSRFLPPQISIASSTVMRRRSVACSFMMPEITAGWVSLIERGAGQPPRGVELIGRAGDPRQRLLDALELSDRHMELLADARTDAGGARAIGRACR